MEKLKIFISGTQDDMKPERDAVDRALVATTLASGVRAEKAVSQPLSLRDLIKQQIFECNIYIGIMQRISCLNSYDYATRQGTLLFFRL